MTIEKLFESIKGVRTILGSPYLSKMWLIKGNTVIYGPDGNSDYIYIYRNRRGNALYIAQGCMTMYIRQKDKNCLPDKRTNDFGKAVCNNASLTLLVEKLYDMIQKYVDTNVVVSGKMLNKNEVYFFDEKFKLPGEEFFVSDINQKRVYRVKRGGPLKSFSVFDMSDRCVLKVSNELFHALQYYRFYKNDKLYCEFQQNFVLSRKEFSADIPEGTLCMKEVLGHLADEYSITINNQNIGTITEKLNMTINNMVFDNAVITVQNKEYQPLVIALTVIMHFSKSNKFK